MNVQIDSRTPVIVGVGQYAERIDDEGYRRLSAVQLAAEAARAALTDTGSEPDAVRDALDTVAGVRQFENSTPQSIAPLGRADNYPRAVARLVGTDPAEAILDVVGGQSPQHLVTEMAASIAAGTRSAVLLVGSEAISTARRFHDAPDRPDFSETVGGQLDDRGYGLEGMGSREHYRHGLVDAPPQYGLLENARRDRLGQPADAYARAMGDLFAPMTAGAAANPFAAARTRRTAEELITVTASNRMIADPYRRLLVARDLVNQAAALVLTSVETARKLGIPPERWVFLHGHAGLREPTLLARPDLGRAPSAGLAAREALRVAGITVNEVATFDLYSCFPIAVFNACEQLDLATDDPRGLTVTGGLPYFGGPGNNYSMHAIAETVDACRRAPATYGFVGANGGSLTKYSVGVYCTTPRQWVPDRSAALQAEYEAQGAVEVTTAPHGPARIESYTVRYERNRLRGIIIGRGQDERRFLANAAENDTELLDMLCSGDAIGAPIRVHAGEDRNMATLASASA
ncbi:acetyl-CoA acetyltransferase [Mycobacterium eburneum]|nr:acetyl-CoA acetyltransferase [Mycobacterium eburneum]TDH48363.1 acetyl-CoA acetyltransferase [Mycobacterium eburneum]